MSNKQSTPQVVRLDRRAIRIQMVLNDVTVQQIADQLGMTRQAVYNAMNGSNTTLDTVSNIAAALGVDPLSILTAEAQP